MSIESKPSILARLNDLERKYAFLQIECDILRKENTELKEKIVTYKKRLNLNS